MKENLPLITIIINNYNNKRYIEKAILSAINQTYSNLQIIIQDDHSTDEKTLEIYEKYKKIDKRIEVHRNEKNIQIFASRVRAITEIKGEYTCFMDGDDYYDFDFIRHMYYFLIEKKADVAVCMFAYLIENSLYIDKSIKTSKLEYNKNNNEEIINFLFDAKAGNFFQNLTWNKLYKTKLLKQARDKILSHKWEQIKLYASEDFFINLAILSYANKICIDENFIGNYYRRSDSLEFRSKEKKIFYLNGLNHVYQLTYDNYLSDIKNKETDKLFQDYKQTILRTLSQYLFLFQLDDSYLDFDKIAKYTDTQKDKINELKQEILYNSNQWLIPKTFKFKNKINLIKKQIIQANKIRINLVNGLYIFPNYNNIQEYEEADFFLNQVMLDYLNLALYYDKEIEIFYKENKNIELLIQKIKEIISTWNVNYSNQVKFSTITTLPDFNLMIDETKINNYDLLQNITNSKFIDLIKTSKYKNEYLLLFKIACCITKDYYDFYKKSIFDFSYQLYYLVFISLEMSLNKNETEDLEIKNMMKMIYQTPQKVFSDSFFSLQNKKALSLNWIFLKIVNKYYPFLLNKELVSELFNIFFNNLAFWYESTSVIPNYINWNEDNKIKRINLFDNWQKKATSLKNFRNFKYGIYKLPFLKEVAYSLTNQDIFTNEMFKFLRNHHSLFKFFWKISKHKIK